MFQCVVLSVSSDVILFYRRRKERGAKNGKIKGKKYRNQRAEEKKKVRMAARKQGKTAENHMGARNRQRKNCNMQSWERAKPLSPFEVSPDGAGRRFGLENSGWRSPLGYYNMAKYLPSNFFIDLSIMRRRSLRLPSPDRFPNSDGDTGTFFRVKNYRREFFARKPQA